MQVGMLVAMDNRLLRFLALAVTMLYGVGFTVTHAQAYASVGGVVVGLMWIAVGMFARDGRDRRRRERRV